MERRVIEQLETAIDHALRHMSELQDRIIALKKEKKELEALLAEKEIRIDGLQQTNEELKRQQNSNDLKQYQAKEDKLKERIESMLSKLDDLDLLE